MKMKRRSWVRVWVNLDGRVQGGDQNRYWVRLWAELCTGFGAMGFRSGFEYPSKGGLSWTLFRRWRNFALLQSLQYLVLVSIQSKIQAGMGRGVEQGSGQGVEGSIPPVL